MIAAYEYKHDFVPESIRNIDFHPTIVEMTRTLAFVKIPFLTLRRVCQ